MPWILESLSIFGDVVRVLWMDSDWNKIHITHNICRSRCCGAFDGLANLSHQCQHTFGFLNHSKPRCSPDHDSLMSIHLLKGIPILFRQSYKGTAHNHWQQRPCPLQCRGFHVHKWINFPFYDVSTSNQHDLPVQQDLMGFISKVTNMLNPLPSSTDTIQPNFRLVLKMLQWSDLPLVE